MIEDRIHQLFARAREKFFPEWDASREWQIIAGQRKHHEGETGYCSLKTKRIYIDPSGVIGMLDDGVFALVIHEMCHAVRNCGHTEHWLEEMERAGQVAESLNEPELARMIYTSAYAEVPLDKPWGEAWCKRLHPLIHE